MPKLLAIDPGEFTGWAVYENRTLVACGHGAPPASLVPDEMIIERPHEHRTKARVKDIITLAIRAGEWAGKYFGPMDRSHVRYVEPNTWKGGSLDKGVCHSRMWPRLRPEEQRVVSLAGSGIAEGKRHNMLDAVGIGLHASGRFN
jgi:hypothetical protein